MQMTLGRKPQKGALHGAMPSIASYSLRTVASMAKAFPSAVHVEQQRQETRPGYIKGMTGRSLCQTGFQHRANVMVQMASGTAILATPFTATFCCSVSAGHQKSPITLVIHGCVTRLTPLVKPYSWLPHDCWI